MQLISNELFVIVDTLWDTGICCFSTKEEAEKELKMIQEDLGDNELIKEFKIKHFKEVE